MKTTRTNKNTKTAPVAIPARVGVWNEDGPIAVGSFRIFIASGDSFGPRFVGGSCYVDLATTKAFCVLSSEVEARRLAATLPAGLTVEYHRYDGQNWRNVGAGVVQPHPAVAPLAPGTIEAMASDFVSLNRFVFVKR